MVLEANDLSAGRIIYLISAVIAVAALGISLYTLSIGVKEWVSKRKDNALLGKLFRSYVLLLAMCFMSVEAVAVSLELWLSPTGELHAWSVLLRLVAISWRLNLCALAACFRFAVVLTSSRHKMIWERVSVVVLISNCVALTIWRIVDFLNALKKNPSLDFDTFKEPAASSVLAGLVPFFMYVYGSAVIFLPPLLRRRPSNAQTGSHVEIGKMSLRVTEVAFTGINGLFVTTFLAVTFIPMGILTQRSVVTLVVHIAAAFECFYVYLVRAITGARALYDKVSGGSSKQGSSIGVLSQGAGSSNGKLRDSRYPPLPTVLPSQTSNTWEEKGTARSSASHLSGSSYVGHSYGEGLPPLPQQFTSRSQQIENFGGSNFGSQVGTSVAGSHVGLNAYRPGTHAYGSQVGGVQVTERQGEYERAPNWGATYSSQNYGGNNWNNKSEAYATPFRQ
ncbi:hypothetical protein BJ742DRAFT_857852 [Cladochytrium replicatum]|nr:hypothetical protein BJ742DRAFT_857852 [Cladochytrium replicatum]